MLWMEILFDAFLNGKWILYATRAYFNHDSYLVYVVESFITCNKLKLSVKHKSNF